MGERGRTGVEGQKGHCRGLGKCGKVAVECGRSQRWRVGGREVKREGEAAG